MNKPRDGQISISVSYYMNVKKCFISVKRKFEEVSLTYEKLQCLLKGSRELMEKKCEPGDVHAIDIDNRYILWIFMIQ